MENATGFSLADLDGTPDTKISEDDVRKNEKIVQDQTDIQIKKVEEKVVSKEKEIMTI